MAEVPPTEERCAIQVPVWVILVVCVPLYMVLVLGAMRWGGEQYVANNCLEQYGVVYCPGIEQAPEGPRTVLVSRERIEAMRASQQEHER